MDIRQITPRYHVAPQISASDVAEIKAQGYARIICNRPDTEVSVEQQAAAIGAAAEAAGMDFAVLPLTHDTMNAENLGRQKELAEGVDGKVLAYCASGTRCTVAWALGLSLDSSADEVIATAARAGYDLSKLRMALEAVRAG